VAAGPAKGSRGRRPGRVAGIRPGTLALAARAPRSPRLAAPLDLAGQATAVLGLAALAFGVISGGADGFASTPSLAALGVAFLSLYFQRVLGEPPVTAGLLFLPMTGLLTVASLAAARAWARWGHQLPLRLGVSTSTLGI
jgi:DHA2 family methylenomycin A resistance protein-like MFS transporter